MGEEIFEHFQQAIVNAMADRPILRPRTGKTERNYRDDDDSPNQDEAAPACDENAVEQDTQKAEAMLQVKCKRCDHRIVSTHQPHVRPIVRGKANKSVEFGAKLSVSLPTSDIASVDRISWMLSMKAAICLHKLRLTNSEN